MYTLPSTHRPFLPIKRCHTCGKHQQAAQHLCQGAFDEAYLSKDVDDEESLVHCRCSISKLLCLTLKLQQAWGQCVGMTGCKIAGPSYSRLRTFQR